jgi:phage terminase large subunit-like protein
VGSKGEDGRGYLLEDASTHGSPHKWAERAVAMYDKWDADAVVIEINQGGDMCRHTLQTIRKNLPIIEVRATRGKHVRAEPISALYALGRISHVGTFPQMEDQMCLFTPHGWEGDDDKSPDRAEAAIWLLTELYEELIRDQQRDTKKDDDDEARFYNGGPRTGAESWMG